MSHVVFALFDTSQEVAAAVAELEAAGTPTQQCTVIVHRGGLDRLPTSELALFETGAASMGARLAALGAVAGAIVGLVAAGPLAVVLFTTTAGTMVGALTGILAGASDADPNLHRLAEALEEGKVLLSVEPPSLDCAERVEHILQRHRARIVHRHMLRPLSGSEQGAVAGPKGA